MCQYMSVGFCKRRSVSVTECYQHKIVNKSNLYPVISQCTSLKCKWHNIYSERFSAEVFSIFHVIFVVTFNTFLVTLNNTVWTFQDFSATQILREIKFGNFGCSNTVTLPFIGRFKIEQFREFLPP